MSNCIICETKLGILNKPMFGFGKTKDGDRICTKCNEGLAKRGSKYCNKISKFSTDEFFEGINYNRIKEVREKLSFVNKKLLKMPEAFELPFILTNQEQIERVEQGFLSDRASSIGNGLIVITDNRVIVLDVNSKATSTKMVMEDFPLAKINSISFERGRLKSKLTLICSGNMTSINILSGGEELSQYIRQKISQVGQKDIGKSDTDPIEQIKKLKDLLDSGILTEEEFESKKRELLGKV